MIECSHKYDQRDRQTILELLAEPRKNNEEITNTLPVFLDCVILSLVSSLVIIQLVVDFLKGILMPILMASKSETFFGDDRNHLRHWMDHHYLYLLAGLVMSLQRLILLGLDQIVDATNKCYQSWLKLSYHRLEEIREQLNISTVFKSNN